MLLGNISKTRNDVELADLYSLSQGNLLFTYRKMIIKDKYTTSFLGGTRCFYSFKVIEGLVGLSLLARVMSINNPALYALNRLKQFSTLSHAMPSSILQALNGGKVLKYENS